MEQLAVAKFFAEPRLLLFINAINFQSLMENFSSILIGNLYSIFDELMQIFLDTWAESHKTFSYLPAKTSDFDVWLNIS